ASCAARERQREDASSSPKTRWIDRGAEARRRLEQELDPWSRCSEKASGDSTRKQRTARRPVRDGYDMGFDPFADRSHLAQRNRTTWKSQKQENLSLRREPRSRSFFRRELRACGAGRGARHSPFAPVVTSKTRPASRGMGLASPRCARTNGHK